jgi:hypothetical protein
LWIYKNDECFMNKKNIKINQTSGMAGRIRLEVENANTGEITKQTDWFNNLILDSGLNMKGTGGVDRRCHVGSGSSTPSASDTSLDNFIASVDSGFAILDAGVQIEEFPYYGWSIRQYTFSTGAAEGNISEIGITRDDFSSPSGPLFSRALVLDENGNPTTITILSNEILRVFYELRMYIPMADYINQIEIGGVTHTVTTRPANINLTTTSDRLDSWGSRAIGNSSAAIVSGTSFSTRARVSETQDISSYTGNPGGTQRSSFDTDSYVDGSLERTGTPRWNIDTANFQNGIGRVVFASGVGNYQTRFDPPIMKTQGDELTLDLKVTWGRINIAPVISAADETLDADGSSTTTITVQIKDIFGEDITTGGHSVDITTTHGTLLGSVVDHGDGTYTQELEADTEPVEEVVVNCVVDNQVGVNSAFIEFVEP